MGKRSNFERIERDFYPTPYKAVEPLLPHLREGTQFYEPCAGDGALIEHLKANGHICTYASDIEPQKRWIKKKDMLNYRRSDMLITNPPWDRKILHPLLDLIIHTNIKAWLLFDSDWMHTKQSAEYMEHCNKIVSIGRVKWIPDSKMTGKDNCCWYGFNISIAETRFYGRTT